MKRAPLNQKAQPPSHCAPFGKLQHGGVDATAAWLFDGSVPLDGVVCDLQRSIRAGRLGPAHSYPCATAARRPRRAAAVAAAANRRGKVRGAEAERSGGGGGCGGRHQLRGHDRQPAWKVRTGVLRGDGRWLSSAEGKGVPSIRRDVTRVMLM